MTTTEQAVRHFITGTLGRDVDGVPTTESLLEAGLIDSLGVIALVEFVTQHFGVTVTEDDMVPENFDSIAAIVAFVDGRRGGTHA